LQDESVLESCRGSGVRQQLLRGWCGDPRTIGSLKGDGNRGQTSGSGGSQFWFTDDWGTVPLKAWAEARLPPVEAAGKDPLDVRTMNSGFGGHRYSPS
jgi:hypothetical protein